MKKKLFVDRNIKRVGDFVDTHISRTKNFDDNTPPFSSIEFSIKGYFKYFFTNSAYN